jgi:hypothetical protein
MAPFSEYPEREIGGVVHFLLYSKPRKMRKNTDPEISLITAR